MKDVKKDRLLTQLGEIEINSQERKKKTGKDSRKQSKTSATVLVIDDEHSSRTYAETFLDKEGYNVLLASSVAEARKIIQSNLSISLILTDLSMPGEDGFAVLKFVHTNLRFSLIPVIVTTSHSDPHVVMKAKEKGATDYLVKPYISEVLIDRVKRALSQTRRSVLLVSGDELESSILHRSIETADLRLITRNNGSEACKLLEKEKVNIVITNFVLDDMTGIDLLEKIISAGIYVPVLFIEDSSLKISKEKILSIGGHGVIRKPFNNNEIRRLIHTMI